MLDVHELTSDCPSPSNNVVDNAPSSSSPMYPIRTVSALTGINPVTLRTWERRYKLLEPLRTPKGHRLYSKDQIAMLNRVVEMLEKGTPISRINLSHLLADSENNFAQEEEFWARLIHRMVIAVGHFDETTLESTYNEALALYSVDTVTEKLLMPMLVRLGETWAAGEGSIAEEHFFGVYLRNKLGARFHHRKRLEYGPILITACVPGERHEAGLLLFALSAYDHQYRCVLLGADIPLLDIASAVPKAKAQAIVLSASFVQDLDSLLKELRKLVAQVSVPVFIGGYTALQYADRIEATGAIPLGTQIDDSFKVIAATLKKQFAKSLNL